MRIAGIKINVDAKIRSKKWTILSIVGTIYIKALIFDGITF